MTHFASLAIDLMPARLARLQQVVSTRMEGLRIVLDGLADPGNRAAIIRTCEALGLLDVHVVCSPSSGITEEEGSLSPRRNVRVRSPRAITTGSEKWLRMHHHATAGDCVATLRAENFRILCAKPQQPSTDISRSPVALKDIDFGSRTALVFGNETTGISSAMSDLGDGDFTIPMRGLTESFNVSVAAAICVHWGRHARELALGKSTDLTPEAAAQLMQHYQSAGKHYEKKVRQGGGRGLFSQESLTENEKESYNSVKEAKEARRQKWVEAQKHGSGAGPYAL